MASRITRKGTGAAGLTECSSKREYSCKVRYHTKKRIAIQAMTGLLFLLHLVGEAGPNRRILYVRTFILSTARRLHPARSPSEGSHRQ